MIQELTIFLKPNEDQNDELIKKQIAKALFEKKIKVKPQEIKYQILKKSIDARHKQIKIVLRIKAFINEEISSDEQNSKIPQWIPVPPNTTKDKTVIIVGSGPAGLFAALKLLEKGIKPIIIERGKETSKRKIDIASISTKNIVDENSNYCFGEGGAGTFSDGKLYTRSNKRGDINRILKIFNIFGADPKILTDAHPHIGTDKLPKIINSMKEKIISLGGEFHFNTKCTDLIIQKSTSPKLLIQGIIAQDLNTNEEKTFTANNVILATGHSATDIYLLLAKKCPDSLEAKTFAAGVRVEHPRELIDSIQYHGQNAISNLPTAEYKLTTQVEGRGVYSFCMCPGGFVVPSSSGPEEIVVNGMSAAKRNSKWSNAAIVVEIRPEDIPEKFVKKATSVGCAALAGLYFRASIEKLTKENGKDQYAPAQRLTDFLDHKDSINLPPSSYTPGLVCSRIDKWLPSHIEKRLEEGFKNFNKTKKGFVCNDAIIIASETRTSTPVRIIREKDSYECSYIKNLYPAGEGSGYSGGIVSSAMDGENVAEKIIEKI